MSTSLDHIAELKQEFNALSSIGVYSYKSNEMSSQGKELYDVDIIQSMLQSDGMEYTKLIYIALNESSEYFLLKESDNVIVAQIKKGITLNKVLLEMACTKALKQLS